MVTWLLFFLLLVAAGPPQGREQGGGQEEVLPGPCRGLPAREPGRREGEPQRNGDLGLITGLSCGRGASSAESAHFIGGC